MNRIVFPENIIELISTLEQAGHSAYAVGGAVRDSLIGLEAHDWDIACSALPEEILGLFPETAIPTGPRHGTVTVKIQGAAVEVTTFRTDGSYLDHRRPDTVSFVGNIEEDLARRDFTMNAIAANPNGETIDPFGGREDIERKVIRCVGNAELRFEEDSLRMFRAVRFSAKLGFDIEAQTLAAIHAKAPLASTLAAERIFSELDRTLVYDNLSALNVMSTSPLLSHLSVTQGVRNFSMLEALPKNRLYRWTAFCAVMFETSNEAAHFLGGLRADNLVRRAVIDAFDIMSTAPSDAVAWKKHLSRYGEQSCLCAAWAMSPVSVDILKDVLASGECYDIAHLAVGGNDLIALGYSGQEIGVELHRLLDCVIEHPKANTKDELLEIACKQ